MLAKVTGLFRLTRDAELIYSASGAAILKMGLACSEKFKDKETQLFLDAVAFSKPAEILNQYAGTKGTQIFLTGKLQTETWQNKEGKNQSKVSMVVEGFDFVSNGKSEAKPQQQQAPQQSYQQQPTPQQNHQQQPGGQQSIPVYEVDEDEIPFNEANRA